MFQHPEVDAESWNVIWTEVSFHTLSFIVILFLRYLIYSRLITRVVNRMDGEKVAINVLSWKYLLYNLGHVHKIPGIPISISVLL